MKNIKLLQINLIFDIFSNKVTCLKYKNVLKSIFTRHISKPLKIVTYKLSLIFNSKFSKL